MADPEAAYDPAAPRGEMTIGEQSSTYRAFDGLVRWGSLAIASLLLFLVLMFCTRVGFIGAAAPVAILLVAGAVFLRSKPPSIDTL